jgi:hypothetical protein
VLILINRNVNYTLGEKLVVFMKFKKGDPSDLRPQDDDQRLIDKHQIKATLLVIL